jgi:hypothetical protein
MLRSKVVVSRVGNASRLAERAAHRVDGSRWSLAGPDGVTLHAVVGARTLDLFSDERTLRSVSARPAPLSARSMATPSVSVAPSAPILPAALLAGIPPTRSAAVPVPRADRARTPARGGSAFGLAGHPGGAAGGSEPAAVTASPPERTGVVVRWTRVVVDGEGELVRPDLRGISELYEVQEDRPDLAIRASEFLRPDEPVAAGAGFTVVHPPPVFAARVRAMRSDVQRVTDALAEFVEPEMRFCQALTDRALPWATFMTTDDERERLNAISGIEIPLGGTWVGMATPGGFHTLVSAAELPKGADREQVVSDAVALHESAVLDEFPALRIALAGLLPGATPPSTITTDALYRELVVGGGGRRPAATEEEPDEARRLQAVVDRQARTVRELRRELARTARELDRYERPDEPEDTDAVASSPEADDAWTVDEEQVATGPALGTLVLPPGLSGPTTALRLASRFEQVVVTSHALETAAELDDHPKSALWARRTWAALASLDAYAAARAADGVVANFYQYVRDHDHGLISPRTVALRESDSVLASTRMRSQRVRPVPLDVDPSGRALFVEHVRIESGGRAPAPRLYFLDDTAGATGKIVVGYVGPHLTNKRTT